MDQKEFLAQFPDAAELFEKIEQFEKMAKTANYKNHRLGYFFISAITIESEEGIHTINSTFGRNLSTHIISAITEKGLKFLITPTEEEK